MLRSVLLAAVLLSSSCAAAAPALQSALETAGPAAIDALAQAVAQRWGEAAQVHEPSAACYPAPEGTADSFGDDDGEYVYVTCRVRATAVAPK